MQSAVAIVNSLLQSIDDFVMTAIEENSNNNNNQNDQESKEESANNASNSSPSSSSSSSILMIPGPIEFAPSVYSALATKTASHVSPTFMEEFGQCLEAVRAVLLCSPACQPYILSGGGSLGWDCIVASLLQAETRDNVLILNTGYFSDNFRDCCTAYNIGVEEITAAVGDAVTPAVLEAYFVSTKKQYSMIGITHVDTSVAIVNDVSGLAQVIRKYCPNALIAVDGVCSFAAHEFRFSDWDIDVCMTASQKAFGAPPGLCILALSERALSVMQKRTHPIRTWYCSLEKWLPIMVAYEQRKAAYFSTPNVNLVCALNASCKLILSDGMENIFVRNAKFARAFQAAMTALGLSFVAVRPEICAVTITAVKFPANVNGKAFLTACKEQGCIFAGGLHKQIKGTYFRVGHMGISMSDSSGDLLRCVNAIEYALTKCGHPFEAGIGVKTYTEQSTISSE